jgi:methionyl-tRNA synthetase
MAKEKFYITTAIDYVNGDPHIGHALEKTLTDTIARWQRLNGKKVFFLTGTDENAQKNAQAAKKAKTPIKKFIDKNAEKFKELYKKLNISYDRFIRTTELVHKKKSQELFQKAFDSGDIYKGKYSGLYCEGCEAFKTEKDLVDKKCPEHKKAPKALSEETYFFKLSKYNSQIEKFVNGYIIPEKRKNEILSRLKSDKLKDISVSRENLDWGVPVPIDKNHKIYVWFDALINYISGSNGNWPADLHVIGKDINWFHSVIWPGILLSTDLPLPKKLLVHGFLNLKGQKMSKSTGNVLDPNMLIDKYGVDAVRYSLLKSSTFEDSDYSEEILIERNNNELANKLGNLVSRVSTLAEKCGINQKVNMEVHTSNVVKGISEYIENYELDKALGSIFALIDTLNEFIQEKKPWETYSKEDIYELVTGIRLVTILLSPFIPETSEKIAKTFNFKISLDEIDKPLPSKKPGSIKKSEILFKKIK